MCVGVLHMFFCAVVMYQVSYEHPGNQGPRIDLLIIP